MAGLLFLGVVLLWVALCAWLARRIGRLLPERPWRGGLTFLIFVALVPMLVIDEIVAAPQFAKLCREQAIVHMSNDLPGKHIWSTGVERFEVRRGSVEIFRSKWSYVLADTDKTALEYSSFDAKGGWFIRTLGVSNTNSPLVFVDHCAPEELRDRLAKLNVTVSDKPKELQ